MRQNIYVYSIYLNPDLDDWVFDCVLASMAALRAEDVCASFLFVGDLNGHHREWLINLGLMINAGMLFSLQCTLFHIHASS